MKGFQLKMKGFPLKFNLNWRVPFGIQFKLKDSSLVVWFKMKGFQLKIKGVQLNIGGFPLKFNLNWRIPFGIQFKLKNVLWFSSSLLKIEKFSIKHQRLSI